MNIKEEIHNIIADAIKNAISDGKLPNETYPHIKVEYPNEQKFGDYATPFALESARILRKSPMDIGLILKEYISKSHLIEQIDVVKPGFINMFLSYDYLYNNLNKIIDENDTYGRRIKEKPRRVNIEFVSANPTGPLNIVSARAAAIGDTLANLIEANGDTADREFYINDYGNQVDLLGLSVYARLKELKGENIQFPENGYHGEYIKDIAAHIHDNYKNEIEQFNNEDHIIEFLAKKAIEYNVKTQKMDLEKFNVHFKTWFSERTLHEQGEVQKTLELLESLNTIYTEENKKLFRSTDYSDDKDRVVVRDDGRPTYLLADIAYHRNKINRNYDIIIDIWGPDHHGYIARLAGAVKAMGFDEKNFKILVAQQVNLLMEGEMVKMSKRLGNFSTMKELIEEIGVDVARYFFIMRSLDSQLDFDLGLAKKESSENPVFYLQYAHARICSIFKKAPEKNIQYDPEKAVKEFLNNPEAIIILKYMLKFPEEVTDAAESCEPHRIATYLLRLAQALHKFYTVHKVLTDDHDKSNTYLKFIYAVRIVIKNGLKLLGVSAPERM